MYLIAVNVCVHHIRIRARLISLELVSYILLIYVMVLQCAGNLKPDSSLDHYSRYSTNCRT